METRRLKVFLLIAGYFLYSCDNTAPEQKNDYPITPVDFTHVKLQDGFWKDWVITASDITVPYTFKKCKETGRIDNFKFAGGIKEGIFKGDFGFNDSDLYKIIEGASYSIMLNEDPEMEAYLDTLIYYISEAQEEDGYLYTAWTLKANEYNDFRCCTYNDEGQWFGTTGSSHEFYNAGHLYEAAVAHFLATEKKSFLDVAIKNADLVYDVCITQGHNYVPGHQEIEIGLVKLYRVTGNEKYLELAKHFLDTRAKVKNDEYSQAHQNVTEQKEAVGHAVRANYMYSAMADIAALTGDSAYLRAIGDIWENVAGKKLSITGGVGARHRGEAYGDNYELPNQPYNETCAAIANVFWNHRMFLLNGDGKYIDVLERTLYNGVISGLSIDGTTFFYPNTLQHDGEMPFNKGTNGRSPWFDCSCCPSNLSRFIPSVGGYAYAVKGGDVYLNLFINSRADLVTGEGTLILSQKSNYPWDGNIEIDILNEAIVDARIHIRIPGWVRNAVVPSDLFKFDDEEMASPSLIINGKVSDLKIEKGYAILEKRWQNGDKISLKLPMQDRKVVANDKVKAKNGLVAIEYGPIVYCAEEIDNNQDVIETPVKKGSRFTAKFMPDMLGGINMLEGKDLKLVPYYAWANREVGKMNIWFEYR